MIKLWKNESKNRQFKEIIQQERSVVRSCQWRLLNAEEKVMDITKRYNCSDVMAKKVIWIICGDAARQKEICNTLGKEYAKYIPAGM